MSRVDPVNSVLCLVSWAKCLVTPLLLNQFSGLRDAQYVHSDRWQSGVVICGFVSMTNPFHLRCIIWSVVDNKYWLYQFSYLPFLLRVCSVISSMLLRHTHTLKTHSSYPLSGCNSVSIESVKVNCCLYFPLQWECTWFVILCSSFFLLLFWAYFWLVARNDFNEFNW